MVFPRLPNMIESGNIPSQESWLEIEDIMAAKHAYKRQITEFKYGGYIRLSVGKFWKSDTVIFWKRVLKMPSSEMY